METLARKMLRYSITLALVTAIASGSLTYTYSATKDRIEIMKEREQVNAVKEVCGRLAKGASVSSDSRTLERISKKMEGITGLYVVEKNGKAVAYGILSSARGYGGPMSIMVGVDGEGKVLGVKVLDQKETPGLGDKVTASEKFLSQFTGKTPDDPLEINKDIKVVSGATISSKGVNAGVKEALKAFRMIEEVN